MGFTSGLFWGAIFGGLAGLMNAPREGKETRRRLKLYMDQTTADIHDVRYKVDNLSLALERLADEGLGSVKSAGKDIERSVREFKEESQPRIKRIMKDVQALQETIEEESKELTREQE